jgi:hypothetical protein
MYSLIHLTSTSLTHNGATSRSPFRRGVFLIVLALASFALMSTALAVDPAPDGGYPNSNTAEGEDALFSLDTDSPDNTAIGASALYSEVLGIGNTAVGAGALYSNTRGEDNTATGRGALALSTTDGNTATGAFALSSSTTGDNNTATGESALRNSKTGSNNTATGARAMAGLFGSGEESQTGHDNTADGAFALQNITTGSFNTATGVQALFNNTTGIDNTAAGDYALFKNTGGFNNSALGVNALYNNTGSNNVALGFSAGVNLTTGSNNIDIGNYGVAGESNKIRIGTKGTQTATFIAGISGVAVTGNQVVVNSNGKLGVAGSSARFKEAIKPMDKASEAILALQPVTFRYKSELDSEGIPQFGLVAEQVEEVNPDLVARDEEGKSYTVRYEAVNAMLLNEFLKEHRKVESQDKRVQELETTVGQLKSALKEQASQIQKVNEELEVSKAASQLVVNNPVKVWSLTSKAAIRNHRQIVAMIAFSPPPNLPPSHSGKRARSARVVQMLASSTFSAHPESWKTKNNKTKETK